MNALRTTSALALVLALAACAERTSTLEQPDGDANVAPAPSGLVLRVDSTGGFTTPAVNVARLPAVSVYADGRVITDGPVPAIYPGPAMPNLQVAQLGPDAVQALLDSALEAGVADTTDLGSPPVADATTTRFTVVTTTGTIVREVYALWETPEGGLTAEQQEARGRLGDLLSSLTDTGEAGTTSYAAESVAAVVSPWIDPQDGLEQPDVPWPGPALPGEPTGGMTDVRCVTATGAEAQAVAEAARAANAATPWVTGDGSRWTVSLRPLLPDETGCGDLVD